MLVLAAGTRHTAERISGADGRGARLIVAVMVWMLGTLRTTVPFAEVSTPIRVHPRLWAYASAARTMSSPLDPRGRLNVSPREILFLPARHSRTAGNLRTALSIKANGRTSKPTDRF